MRWMTARDASQADCPGGGNARQVPNGAKVARLASAVPSSGNGHTFESCRVRQNGLWRGAPLLWRAFRGVRGTGLPLLVARRAGRP
jgi:hypothetical protein